MLKKLLGQTAIYGLSTMLGRFLNYLLVRLHTGAFAPSDYGVVSELYAYSGFLSVLLIFGMETGYFRFARGEHKEDVYPTALIFLLSSSLFFFLVICALSPTLGNILHYQGHEYYFIWFALILGFDAIGAIAFARLRHDERPMRFATVKLLEIAINIGLNLFFLYFARNAYQAGQDSWLASCYQPEIGVGYIFIANLVASACKLLLLTPLFFDFRWKFNSLLFKDLIRYSLPMVPIGLAGIINETFDRPMLKFLLPYDEATNMAQVGIYSACYKISIVMSLFIQAYRYAAEPFFFKQSGQQHAKQLFADVMHFFVLFCCIIFLLVTLFLPYFKFFIGRPEYYEGLKIVPVLLMANLCLGMYVNLSVWYKLTDRTGLGAWVAVGGAVLTLVLNYWLIPVMGYMGAAWATLACYGSMAAVSYVLGQKYYPVPYGAAVILCYLGAALAVYAVSLYWQWQPGGWPLSAALLWIGFIVFAVLMWRFRISASSRVVV
ncbi:MAG: oligosaccharide flippase family protein [Chitinophagales bacterium]